MKTEGRVLHPKRRTTYQKYKGTTPEFGDLFDEIDAFKDQRGAVVRVWERYNHTGLKLSTLYRRYAAYHQARAAMDKTEVEILRHNEGHRRGAPTALTPEEEHELLEDIEKLLDGGLALVLQDLSEMATEIFERTHPHATRSTGLFQASIRWAEGFKRRHDLTSLRPRLTEDHDHSKCQEDIVTLHTSCRLAVEKYTREFVFNGDETAVRIYNKLRSCLQRKRIPTRIVADEKTSLTGLFTIAADGALLPGFFVLPGKTSRVETNFKPEPVEGIAYHTTHTESGWSTAESMVDYIDKVLVPYRPPTWGPSSPHWGALILDTTKAHFKDEVRAHIAEVGLELIRVPAHHTGDLQPLDCDIFGPLKVSATREWRLRRRADPALRLKKSDGATFIMKAWQKFPKRTIRNSFDHSCFGRPSAKA